MLKKIKKRDFASVIDVSSKDLNEIFNLATELKENPYKKSKALLNKTIALIFAKPSLRTRVSFEVGINQLGGSPITIKMEEIKIGKREDVKDIAHVLSRYIDGIVIRTYEQKEIDLLAKYASVPIINALSDEEHPCQAVSDIFTIKETFPNLKNIKLAYLGDGNNVAHSLLICAALANINISIGTPKGYEPNKKFIDLARRINSKIKVEIINSAKLAAKNSNVLYTDVWTSMGQESEAKKRKKIFSKFQINENILSLANKNAIVMHCLPAHKGEEITSDVFNKFSEVIYRQAENRLHIQKAILLRLIGHK